MERRIELRVFALQHVAWHVLDHYLRVNPAPLDEPLPVKAVKPELRRRDRTAVNQALVRLDAD